MWNTYRDHLVLEYEIPKWDGDLGTPNAFVPLTPALARRKARHLREVRQQRGGLMPAMGLGQRHHHVGAGADAGAVLQLTGVYHNLLRRWAET